MANWDAIGAIGETVAAVGVILTLGFLAFQIRQNTRLLKTNSNQLEQNRQLAVAESFGQSDSGREQAMIAIAQPGGRQWWKRYSNTYPKRFREVIHRQLAELDHGEGSHASAT